MLRGDAPPRAWARGAVRSSRASTGIGVAGRGAGVRWLHLSESRRTRSGRKNAPGRRGVGPAPWEPTTASSRSAPVNCSFHNRHGEHRRYDEGDKVNDQARGFPLPGLHPWKVRQPPLKCPRSAPQIACPARVVAPAWRAQFSRGRAPSGAPRRHPTSPRARDGR
jgi:hypothetical protein